MNKRLLSLLAAVTVAMGVSAQTVRTAVDDVETIEEGRHTSRFDVTPYSDEDDIEKGAYSRSSYYMSLNGNWHYDLRTNYSDRSSEVEGRDFSADAWPTMTLPCLSLQRNGDALALPAIGNKGRIVHEHNLSAVFYRSFYVDDSWRGHSAVLRMQGRSAYHVWVNRQYVGYAEDSRAVNEFDITKQLRVGKDNDITIQLVGLSTGSLLESDYDPWLNGITGDVAITFYPETYIDDYAVHADYNDATHSGQFSVDAMVMSSRNKGRYYLEAELWNPQGREVAKMGKWIYLDKRNGVSAHVDYVLKDVLPWSAERPSRYTVVLRLLDEKMQPLMSTGSRIGFRSVAVDGSRLLVNGSPVVLRGVAYVDNGQSVEDMRDDLLRMKRNNINAVRTVHYSPARGVFYDLCDELGLFVMCDANLQPFSSGKKAIATDADYADNFVARVRTMYEQLKNHPSVILWSLGNSTDNGICMTQAYRALKRLDTSRPTVFAGATTAENSDLKALNNPTVEEIRKLLANGTRQPLLVAAYGDAEGNPYGGMQTFWQSLSAATAGGFAATWNNYTSGIIETGYAIKHTGIGQRDVVDELREAYRPFDITLQNLAPDAAEFNVVNQNHTLSLGDYRVSYSLYSNLKPRIIEGDISTPLQPGASHLFKVRLPKLTLYAGEELMIRFVVRPRNIASLDAKTVLSTVTFVLPASQIAKQPLPDYDRSRLTMSYDDSTRMLTVSGKSFSVQFDCGLGSLSQMTVAGESLMQKPLMLDFWRETVGDDAELNSRATRWQQYQNMRSEVVDVDYRATDSVTVLVNVMLRYVSATGTPLFDVRQRYTVLYTGDVLVDNEVRSVQSMAEPSRVGCVLGVAAGLDSLSWVGRDRASYSDRKAGSQLGSFNADARRVRGPHADTRRLVLSSDRAGLYLDMLDTLFSYELTQQGRGYQLHADYRMAPAGGLVTPALNNEMQKYHFVLHLRPYNPQLEETDDFCRTIYPVEQHTLLPMPVITASSEHFDAPMRVTLSLPADGGNWNGVEIRYTLDGSTPDASSPRYTAPFTIEGSTTVNARAMKAGISPSFVASRSFYFDYIATVSFENKPNTPYNRHYDRALSDGETGSVDDLSHAWIGFSGNDMVVTVTLSKAVDLDEVRLRFAHQPSAWTFAPTAVTVSTSSDGVQFSEPVSAEMSFDPTDAANNSSRLVEPTVRVATRGVRYVRIVAKNVGRVPDWHTAKGLRAWLMTDEVTLTEMMK